jgi:hypothetical protein
MHERIRARPYLVSLSSDKPPIQLDMSSNAAAYHWRVLISSPRLLILGAAFSACACARQPGLFNDANAIAHVSMLAGTIGSRPVGSAANARARDYVVDQLKEIGFQVRVQETDARRHELGRTARVSNIIGILPGEKPEALGIVSHYDSSPDAPGATDDALGVAVTLEAARVLASASRRQWTLFALITDGEEAGLMGAAALVTDREVTSRLRAYLNLESIGSSGTSVLFETGPGNGWLVAPWAKRAPHPRGGSYAIEVYTRLPNDTDFSILKTRDIPGLNFAAVGDSYSYHTARDTPERLARETVRTTGENVVSIATALQDVDITARTTTLPVFFDIGGTVGVSYGMTVQWLLSALALIAGVVAWVRVSGDAVRTNGVLRWILTIAWGWLGGIFVGAAMAGTTWLLRFAREVYHPWYASPGRLLLLLIAAGATCAWAMARAGRWLPGRSHPARHPALTWSVVLPIWIALAAAALWFAPAAAYLWVLPLLSAGVLLTLVPPGNDSLVRIASAIVLCVSGTLWLRETSELSRFIVAIMGRLPMVTPFFVYAAVLSAAGLMVVPPLIASVATRRPLRRPWAVTAIVAVALAAAFGVAYAAPAYTHDQPLRRYVRALQDGDAASATWEVASVEPGLDLAPDAPGEWTLTDGGAAPASIPWGRYSFPFVFRAAGPSLGPPPASVTSFALKPLADGSQLSASVTPREPGLLVTFVLPPGITPARSSLPGAVRLGRWTAAFAAVPLEGIAWEASFRLPPSALEGVRVAVTSARLPGGAGWQSLPGWLPQDTAVWSANGTWVLPPPGSIAPVPPLR